MTERIDHVAIATERLDLAQTEVSANWLSITGEEKADLIAVAQVHATLALVEQQRIANLIALARPHKLLNGAEVLHTLHDHVTGELRADVAEAVGL